VSISYSSGQGRGQFSCSLTGLKPPDIDRSQKPEQSVPPVASCSTKSQPTTPAEGPSANTVDLQPTQAAKERRVRKALAVVEGLCRYASYELKEEDMYPVLKEVEELKDAIDDLEREA
jgi:hypothetical protein